MTDLNEVLANTVTNIEALVAQWAATFDPHMAIAAKALGVL